MARSDHYAVLVAINYYPGLRDLGGPENDIAAFEQWLKDPAGGDVDPQNIKLIRSSDYTPQAADPNDANPTQRAFIKALDAWARVDRNTWRERIGERLYIYMAGHGFTAGTSLNDPALFSAAAQNGNTDHIAGYRYASRVANAGFFDEIVLIMDCCQDVLKASQVLDPTWSPPDRQKSGAVKLLQAFGAPRGEAAFESEESPGVKRGYFSRVLIEALRAALPDTSGFVTGTTLKNQFQQIWGDRYRSVTGYDPPIYTPAGPDIKLFRPGPVPLPVTFLLRSPVAVGTQLTVESGPGSSVFEIPVGGASPTATLPPGIYKARLTGTDRAALFEVDGSEQQPVEL